MNTRLQKMIRRIPVSLAGVYVVRGLYVFLISLGTENHEWWPLFFQNIFWPMSDILNHLDKAVLNLFITNPQSIPDWVWILNDYVMGALYIFGGGIWVWFWSRQIVKFLLRFVPKHEEPAAV